MVPSGAAMPDASGPRLTFAQLGLAPWLALGLEVTGHEHPSPVQQRIVPALLQGSSVFLQGCRPCTGKTIACLAAFLHLIDWTADHPQAICLVPTRELARHIFDVIVELRTSAGCHPGGCCLMVGGKKDPPEPEADDGGRCVVVATVGRLHERAHQREIDLRRVRFVLLDEADDSLPSSQVESVWSFLDMMAVQWAVTCIRISPTVERFVEKYLAPSQRLRFLADDPCPRSPIEHLWVPAAGPEAKLDLLLRVLDVLSHGRAVVFCSAITQKYLHRHLMRRYPRFVQHQRNVVEYFTEGAKALVTTDILARGVHLKDVSLIININLPPDIVTYLQRAGRGSGLLLQRHLLVLNLLEAEDAARLPRLEEFCAAAITEVSAERAVLQCGITSGLA
eukprot:EG_transcript_3528